MRTITENGQAYLVSDNYPEAPFVKVLADGWEYADGRWVAPTLPSPKESMTKYKFLNGRLVKAERIGLDRLRDQNNAAGENKDYDLADFYNLFDAAQDVDTSDPNTIQGITDIGTALGWTPARIAEILS